MMMMIMIILCWCGSSTRRRRELYTIFIQKCINGYAIYSFLILLGGLMAYKIGCSCICTSCSRSSHLFVICSVFWSVVQLAIKGYSDLYRGFYNFLHQKIANHCDVIWESWGFRDNRLISEMRAEFSGAPWWVVVWSLLLIRKVRQFTV